MPKWTPYISGERAVVVGGDYIYCYALTHEESVKFAAAHNADIDALTAEVDALRAELARVKAESLRVVVDGEACDWEMLEDSDKDGLFVVDAQLCCRERCTMNKVVNVSTGAVSHIYDEDGVQPVRLERWEDE